MKKPTQTFYEFFAGGGMARAGLGDGWECLFANDFDAMKARTYAENWGDEHLRCDDVAKVRTSQLPGQPDLVWASFPCQDLSLAGGYLGLGNAADPVTTRSGTFWPFWALVRALKREKRGPRIVVLENVYGALTSRDGKDFSAICSALSGTDYRFGAIVMDAVDFLPQSRQRVFFIAIDAAINVPPHFIRAGPDAKWHPRALVQAYSKLFTAEKNKWLWWNLPLPAPRQVELIDLIEVEPVGVAWHSESQTRKLISMMTALNLEKLELAQLSGERKVGCLYKRTRPDEAGVKHQRAEVRFDGVAGCLRTPSGGSSRQTILLVEGVSVRSRLLSPRELVRLMGLPEHYKLPQRYNDTYYVAGDGICVPVVRHLSENLLKPIVGAQVQLALFEVES